MTVLQCRTHRRAFTLYPLRHLPYERLAIAPVVGLDGELLRSTDGEPALDGKRPPPAWSTTLFESAFAVIHAPTTKLTDARWWATEAPARLAQGATILVSTRRCQCRRPTRSRAETAAVSRARSPCACSFAAKSGAECVEAWTSPAGHRWRARDLRDFCLASRLRRRRSNMRLLVAVLLVAVAGCYPADPNCPPKVSISWNIKPKPSCMSEATEQVRLTLDGEVTTYPCSVTEILLDNRWASKKQGQMRLELIKDGSVIYAEDRPFQPGASSSDDTGGCADPGIGFAVECPASGCRKVLCYDSSSGCQWSCDDTRCP